MKKNLEKGNIVFIFERYINFLTFLKGCSTLNCDNYLKMEGASFKFINFPEVTKFTSNSCRAKNSRLLFDLKLPYR